MKIIQEVEQLSRGYVRKGGKTNRKQQRGRMLAFAQHCAELGMYSLGQIGRAQVISYWQSIRHLQDSTLYGHWRALCLLWTLSGKAGKPPKPHQTRPTKE